MRKQILGFGILVTMIAVESCWQNEKNIKYGYYPNNRVKFIKRYKNDMLDGQAQWFYLDGMVETMVSFKDGKELGNAYYFYPSGTLKSFRYWRDGKMVGYLADYYDDTLGTIKSVLYFQDGQLTYKKNFDSLGKFISQEGVKPGGD
jgi:antitoxin component YwqK of YwqJK toxin-antitoxin module